jgi:hypothetical protein
MDLPPYTRAGLLLLIDPSWTDMDLLFTKLQERIDTCEASELMFGVMYPTCNEHIADCLRNRALTGRFLFDLTVQRDSGESLSQADREEGTTYYLAMAKSWLPDPELLLFAADIEAALPITRFALDEAERFNISVHRYFNTAPVTA